MKEYRKTAQGMEYWDKKEKRTIFVPAGVEVKNDDNKADANENEIELIDMTVTQLKKFAEDNNIEIPSTIKVKGDIIDHIEDTLTADDE